ncbi:MAG: hypothetical protein R6U21_03400 [Thermoplasmatota archaeon]
MKSNDTSKKTTSTFFSTFLQVGYQAIHTTATLLKIMIPVTIIVKILHELGFIDIIGSMLSPAMQFLGLPGETGLVWATAMITNIYGGLLVYISIAGEQVFSIAEVTVLATMILIAHSLPVEVSIARKAGVSAWFTLLLRIGSAILIGWMLHLFLSSFRLLTQPAQMTWQAETNEMSLISWFLRQIQNYVMIFLIIFAMLLLMKTLEKLGIIEKINRFFEPGLNLIGLSKNAAPITIIGVTLGLSYGGGLIITEARSGKLGRKDAFLSVSLMGLSHSLIEDTILMLTIGASLLGIFFFRVFFTLLVIVLLVKLIRKISEKTFFQFLYHH